MKTIGEQLRAARIAQNLSIEDVSAVTKIRSSFLKCLEDGQYERLPDRFCLISFQRQYASVLGLDEAAAVAAVRGKADFFESTAPVTEEEAVVPSVPTGYFIQRAMSAVASQTRKHLGAITTALVALGLVCGGVYWWYVQSDSGEVAESASETIDAPVVPVEPQPEPDSARPLAASQEPEAEQPTAPEQLAPETSPAPEQAGAEQAVAAVSDADDTVGAPATAQPAPQAQGTPASAAQQPAGAIQVEIRASGQVWMEAIADGSRRTAALLQPGAVRRVSANENVELTLGDAGAAVLLINGEEQDRIGNSGQVRRIRVTASGWTYTSGP